MLLESLSLFTASVRSRISRERGSTARGTVEFHVPGSASPVAVHCNIDGNACAMDPGPMPHADVRVEVAEDVLEELRAGRPGASKRLKVESRTRHLPLADWLHYLLHEPPTNIVELYRHAERMAGSSGPVRDVASVAPDQIVDWRLKRRPFVVDGLGPHWPCWRWTEDDLRGRLGAVRLGPTDLRSLFPGSGHSPEWVGARLPAELATEFGHFDVPFLRLLPDGPVASAARVIAGQSPQDARKIMHRDPGDGHFFQVVGSKRFVLISPDQHRRLYPLQSYANSQGTWVDALNPNYDLHPDFRGVRSFDIVIRPGQMLFLPTGWFHAVYELGPSFSVNFFCGDIAATAGH